MANGTVIVENTEMVPIFSTADCSRRGWNMEVHRGTDKDERGINRAKTSNLYHCRVKWSKGLNNNGKSPIGIL